MGKMVLKVVLGIGFTIVWGGIALCLFVEAQRVISLFVGG